MKATPTKRAAVGATCGLALAFTLGTASAGEPDAFTDLQPSEGAIDAALMDGDSEGNGTDPRDFAAKFMPYARFTSLDNGLESFEVAAFGLFPIPIGKMFDQPDYKWAVTYEFPMVKYVDASDAVADLPPGFVDDDEVWGTGDLNMRLLIPFWQGKIGGIGMAALTGTELWFPTASDDLLGTGKWQVAPHLTVVADLVPERGVFLASMNFWRTSFGGDGDRADIDMYIGRHFLNIPFGDTGFYMLPELQTIMDREDDDDWEIWFGPEFGKIIAPGRIMYAKPGFGIDPDPDEREWSFEAGYRHFF